MESADQASVHGQGDRPRLLRDLRAGCGSGRVGPRAAAPRAQRGPPDERRDAGRVTRQPRALGRGRPAHARDRARARLSRGPAGAPRARRRCCTTLARSAFPDSIVMKPGRSRQTEWAVMRKHPEIGASMLEGIAHDELAGLGPLSPRAPRRHRIPARPDGRRDPAGVTHPGGRRRLRGDDARPRVPPRDRSRGCLRGAAAGAGTQFDEEIVDAFLRVLKAESGSVLRSALRRS